MNIKKIKLTKKIVVLLALVPFLIVWLFGTYSLERNKWINKAHPYHKAKEWLILVNILILPQIIISKIPYVDERSMVMKPFISLQDFFIKKWQENLPNDDAEKYLAWYLFRLNLHIVPNVQSTILYTDEIYSFDEVRDMLDKMWFVLEKLHKYKAKDIEFEEMRYTAFLKLSYLYVKNAMAYWYNEKEKRIEMKRLNHDERMKRFIQLDIWLDDINNYYKKNYPRVYEKNRSVTYDNKRLHQLMVWILDYYDFGNRYLELDGYCFPDFNPYLDKYITSRNNLLLLKPEKSKAGQRAIEKTLSDFTDEELNKICKNLKFIKGLKHVR